MKNQINQNHPKYYIYSLMVLLVVFVFYSVNFDTFLSKHLTYFMNDEKKIRFKAEEELIDRLNDPSSYEFISFEEDNLSTIFYNQDFKKYTKNDIKINDDYKLYRMEFRAKNKIGALIINNVNVITMDGVYVGLKDDN